MGNWEVQVDRPTWERVTIQVEADSGEDAMARAKQKARETYNLDSLQCSNMAHRQDLSQVQFHVSMVTGPF